VSQTRTEPWRRQATLAGRVLEGQPGDLVLPVLLVLGARVRLLERAGAAPAEMPVENAVQGRGGLWLDLWLPEPEPATGHALETLARSALDAPVAAVATQLRLNSGSIAASRVATSALPSPRRAPSVEAALAGHGPDGRTFAAAQAALAADIAPADDHRASAEYRAQIAPVLLARALRRAAAAAQGRPRAPRS
jgi:CO/xanthine dehydrogenase FAD-binding subunit